jgi:hypothetical protein
LTSGSPTPASTDFFVTDPDQLLQRRWFGSEVNATLGKTANLYFPGVDLDVDSDKDVAREAPELSTCAALTASNFHRHEDYRPLIFAGPQAAAGP